MSTSVVPPVFIKTRSIPDSSNDQPSVLEVCLAAERETGQGTVVGAQVIGGLWRIYPATKEARSGLLTKGMRMRGTLLQLSGTNPFILRDDTGEEKPATKVWIDNLPISVADSVIEEALIKATCELRSPIKLERARDADGKLTRFLTGRRFVFVTVPPKPLEKSLRMSMFTAKIYHKEQKQAEAFCSRCLQKGHHVSACSGDIVCKQCKKPGHKRGDPVCEIEQENTGNTNIKDSKETTRTAHKEERQKKEERGRTGGRQTTLHSSLRVQNTRSRSETPKRRRSGGVTSPTEAKQARRNHGESVRDPSPHSQSETEYNSQVWG